VLLSLPHLDRAGCSSLPARAALLIGSGGRSRRAPWSTRRIWHRELGRLGIDPSGDRGSGLCCISLRLCLMPFLAGQVSNWTLTMLLHILFLRKHPVIRYCCLLVF
jgi:hypothetical protein